MKLTQHRVKYWAWVLAVLNLRALVPGSYSVHSVLVSVTACRMLHRSQNVISTWTPGWNGVLSI